MQPLSVVDNRVDNARRNLCIRKKEEKKNCSLNSARKAEIETLRLFTYTLCTLNINRVVKFVLRGTMYKEP